MPFVRLLVPFVAGIYFQPGISPKVFGSLAVAGLLLSVFLRTSSIYRQFRFRFVTGLSYHAILFAFGCFNAFVHDVRNSPLWFGHYNSEQLVAISVSDPNFNKTGYYFDVYVTKRLDKRVWHSAAGKIRVRIADKKTSVFSGSILRFHKMPQPVRNRPGSPFDYQAYLANQNIFHQISLNSSELEILKAKNASTGFILKLRTNILSTLDRAFPERSERALAKALLVGERAELEESVLNAYRDTGVIHVIAISGLHLGLIYGMLIMILKPLTGKRKGKLLVNVFTAITLRVFT